MSSQVNSPNSSPDRSSPPLDTFTSSIINPTPSRFTPLASSSLPVPPPQTTATSSGGTHFAVAPGGARLSVCTLTGVSWPEDLILDLGKANWIQWSDKFNLIAMQQGFEPWLDGSLPCPDASNFAEAAFIWKRNDAALRAFLQSHISAADVHLVRPLPTARLMFEKLKATHEQQGAFAQVNLLLKSLQLKFTYEKPIRDTLAELRTYFHRIAVMGPLKTDDIFAVMLLNAMNEHFGPLRQTIHTLASSSNFTSEMIAARMLEEDKYILERVNAGQPANPYSLTASTTPSSAFAAVSTRPRSPRPACSNCKREGHLADFCISPGGKMAGRPVDEAKAAYRASLNRHNSVNTTNVQTNRPPRPHQQSAHITETAHTPSTSSTGTVFVNGLPYVPDPNWASRPPAVADNSAHITEVTSTIDTNDYQYHAFFAYSNPPSPSISFSSAFSISSSSSSSPSSLPFIIDTGATCHISPILSDFKCLRPITPHPIKGLGDLCVNAVGMGTIELKTSSGTLSLNNAFYVPNSSVRLISVFLLGDSDYTSHFYPRQGFCFISDANNSIVAKGTALPGRKLFTLSEFHVVLPPSKPSTSFAHYTTRLPDIDTWHKRLGHCGHRTVIDMARSHSVLGMHVDLSSPPPKCEHCILGKQTRSPVPKIREGTRAGKPLGRVYVDLCGPMSAPSRTGNMYCMNVIDDFSGFVWSIPLRFKDQAAPALKAWLIGLEIQTPHRLSSFVTDNGELASLQIQQWCTEKGILHLFTAPYTSAQNGRAERLHRTLLDKARAMISACHSPLNMWDEFCATAAYLTNFTGASANHGKTPYELWYGRQPSLSHLREIGCRAFALIPTHNPKLHHRSIPCTLIGYAPQSKAYRLWDQATDRIFNSFHVSFIELHESPHATPSSLPNHPHDPIPSSFSSSFPPSVPIPSVQSTFAPHLHHVPAISTPPLRPTIPPPTQQRIPSQQEPPIQPPPPFPHTTPPQQEPPIQPPPPFPHQEPPIPPPPFPHTTPNTSIDPSQKPASRSTNLPPSDSSTASNLTYNDPTPNTSNPPAHITIPSSSLPSSSSIPSTISLPNNPNTEPLQNKNTVTKK